MADGRTSPPTPPAASASADAADADAAFKPLAVESTASFGIEEGEAEELESKWVKWSRSVEENKRLVLDEVEDLSLGADAWLADSPRAATRARRRTEWTQSVVSWCPVFYGHILALLVALAALLVSPAQVYCVGIVLDAVQQHDGLSRVQISFLYAAALLLASPMILFHTAVLHRVGLRAFLLLCGLGFCGSLVLMSLASGIVSLFLSWALLLLLGPGMLYPCAEGMLSSWWRAKRSRAQAAAQCSGATLGMVLLPSLLSAASCADGSCWRHAYTVTGVAMVLPVCLLALFLLEGGAMDHNLRLDGEELQTLAARGRRRGSLDEWLLRDVLRHGTFWLAQLSMTVVDANVNAFLFHRQDLLIDVHLDPSQQLTVQVLVGFACVLFTPLGLLVTRKESLLLLSLLLAGSGILLLMQYIDSSMPSHLAAPSHLPHPPSAPPPPGGSRSHLALYAASLLLGAAFGVTNAYATTLWEYLYGEADLLRVRQTSIAITCATSGSAIFVFALSRQEAGSYAPALKVSAVVAFSVAALDLILLAKPEVLDAVVRRAPTWEQLVAWRQRMAYLSPGGKVMECVNTLRRAVGMAPVSSTRANQANPIEPSQAHAG